MIIKNRLLSSVVFAASVFALPAFAQGETVTLSKAEYEALLSRVERIEQLLADHAAPAAKAPPASKSVARRAAQKPAPVEPPVVDAKQEEQEKRLVAVEEALAAQTTRARDDRTRLSTLEQSAQYVTWSYDNGRPVISSGDGRFQLNFRGRYQLDFASFMQDKFAPGSPVQFKDLSSGMVTRRAYFGVEGKVFRDFWYEFRLNFGGSDTESGDAALNLARIAYIGIPNWRLNVGMIQPIFTMADATSSSAVIEIERPAIINVVTDVFGGSDSRRGIELTYQKNDVFRGGDALLVSGAFTGNKAGNNANNHGTDEGSNILGRASYRFWSDGPSGAQIGVSGARVLSVTGTGTPAVPTPGAARTLTFQDRPEVRVDGNRLVSTGGIPATGAWMYGIEAAGNWENFFLGGEYYTFGVERDRACTGCSAVAGDPDFSGWYMLASWVITGEPRAYNSFSDKNEMHAYQAPKVITPFSLDGESWGAWEAIARYSTVDLNWNEGVAGVAAPVGGIRGGDQDVWTLGLNWYPNNNIRAMFQYLIVDVDKIGTVAPFPKVGQKFDIAAVRLQFSF